MSLQHKLTLVVPTFHEAKCISDVLSRITSALDQTGLPYDVLVIDDDSRDGTVELVTAAAAINPRIRLFVRIGERGLSGAILHGWNRADSSILGVIDADGQHPPELLPELLGRILAGCDLAVASRYAPGGSLGSWNPSRRLLSSLAVGLTRQLQSADCRVNDPMSGFFLVRRECIGNLSCQPTGFKLLLELLVRGRIRRATEVPFVFGRRSAGKSKANPTVAWHYLCLLARLYRYSWTRPASAPSAAGD